MKQSIIDQFKKTLELARELPEAQFEFSEWICSTGTHACETVGCLAGHHPCFYPEHWETLEYGSFILPVLKNRPSPVVIMNLCDFYGVGIPLIRYIFQWGNSMYVENMFSTNGLVHTSSLEEVLANLEKVIKWMEEGKLDSYER